MLNATPPSTLLRSGRRNSEIYNHEALRESKLAGVDLHSRSDSAVVGYLYQKYGDTNELWNRWVGGWKPLKGLLPGVQLFVSATLLCKICGHPPGGCAKGNRRQRRRRRPRGAPLQVPTAVFPSPHPPPPLPPVPGRSLDGIFACVIWDERTGYFCAARDPIGICSLYWGRAADGSVWFASEMKALQSKCETIDCFPPVRRRRPAGAV